MYLTHSKSVFSFTLCMIFYGIGSDYDSEMLQVFSINCTFEAQRKNK